MLFIPSRSGVRLLLAAATWAGIGLRPTPESQRSFYHTSPNHEGHTLLQAARRNQWSTARPTLHA